jgi:hypothetical protein
MDTIISPLVKSLVLVLVPLIIKWFIDNFATKKVNATKERLNDIAAFRAFPIDNKDKFVVQENFKYFLKHEYSFSEIKYILETHNPLKAFNALKSLRGYVEFSEEKTNFQSKEAYSTEKKRNKVANQMLAFYFIGSFVALFPIMFFNIFMSKHGVIAIPAIMFFTIFVLLMSIFMMKESSKPKSAEFFIKEFQRPNV